LKPVIELRCESEVRYVFTGLTIVGVGSSHSSATQRALRQFVDIPPQVFYQMAWDHAEENYRCQGDSNCQFDITVGRIRFAVTNVHPYTPDALAAWVALQIPTTVRCEVDPHELLANEILAGDPWWPSAAGTFIEENVIQACGYQIDESPPKSWSEEGD
jgi:hypothetical protein